MAATVLAAKSKQRVTTMLPVGPKRHVPMLAVAVRSAGKARPSASNTSAALVDGRKRGGANHGIHMFARTSCSS